MFTVVITKNNGYGGITETEYHDIKNYRITDDFLILEDSKMGGSYYIPREEVLEFELNSQL